MSEEIRVLCYLRGADIGASHYEVRGLGGKVFTFRKDAKSGRHVLVTSLIRSLNRPPGVSDPMLSVDEFNSIREDYLGSTSHFLRPMIQLVRVKEEDPTAPVIPAPAPQSEAKDAEQGATLADSLQDDGGDEGEEEAPTPDDGVKTDTRADSNEAPAKKKGRPAKKKE